MNVKYGTELACHALETPGDAMTFHDRPRPFAPLRNRPGVNRASDGSPQTTGTSIVVGVGQPNDTRRAALADTAAAMAGPNYATVHLVHVFTPTSFDAALYRLNFDRDDPPHPDTVAQRCGALRDVIDNLTDPGRDTGMNVEVHGCISEGPGSSLVDLATDLAADHIIVGGRSRTPTGKAVFGSSAQHVLLNAPCPVTFVKDA